jgi:hypothetical protein
LPTTVCFIAVITVAAAEWDVVWVSVEALVSE